MVVADPGTAKEISMSISDPVLESSRRATQTCSYGDVAFIDHEEPGLVEPALWHMAHAAAYGCGAVVRNNSYAADIAVAALAQTVGATTVIAEHIDGYVADLWPGVAALVTRSRGLLSEARALLDVVHHHCSLVPSTIETDQALLPVLAHNPADPANSRAQTSGDDAISPPAEPILAAPAA
jgi:hypothetical protein